MLQAAVSRSLDELMLWLDEDRRCRVCGKQFLPVTSWKQRFDRHLNTHSGARPFACPYCSHQCARKDALKLHILRKHGEAASARTQSDLTLQDPVLESRSKIATFSSLTSNSIENSFDVSPGQLSYSGISSLFDFSSGKSNE